MIFGVKNNFQIGSFMKAVGIGFVLCVVYCLFMMLRVIMKDRTWLITAEDIICLTLTGLITFVFILDENYGIVRSYMLFGELIGALPLYIFCKKIIIKNLKKYLHKS